VAEIETFALAQDLRICRLVTGMWQVSGAHGRIESDSAVKDMLSYHDAGLTSWDMADIYGPAEGFFGKFRAMLAASRGEGELSKVIGLTKFVPNPQTITKQLVSRAIQNSLLRMNTSTIDAVQFHWWDYENRSYLDAMRYLTELQYEGKIRHLALTNFDTLRMQEMTEAGFKFVSNQVQYSILDRRPAVKMTGFCKRHGVGLLAYGTLAGGLLSEKYLGRPEPTRADLDTASLQKYKQMIDVWGGWPLFQKLLAELGEIAKKHGVQIPNIATRYVLDKPQVAGVIIGARLGMDEHRKENIRTFDVHLDDDDRKRIDDVASESNDLFASIGDCGDEYR